MKLLVPQAAGLLKTAATPVNLKFAALAGLVGASTVVGAISASSSGEQIKSFLEEAFKPVSDFFGEKISPIFSKIGEGAKGILDGFNSMWEAYKSKKDSIHNWISENLKFSQIREGLNKIVETISSWLETAKEFIKDKLWEFIKTKVLDFFKNWEDSRLLIFQFGTFFKESLVPTLKTLFTSEDGGEQSRMSQLWNLITSEGGIQTVVDTANLYINNQEPFGQMSDEEFSGIIDKLFDNPKDFGEKVRELLTENDLTKEKIINSLNPQGLEGVFSKAEKVIEKTLSTALSSLGREVANSAAKAAAKETIEWWKMLFKKVVLPVFTTECKDSSSSQCFKSPI